MHAFQVAAFLAFSVGTVLAAIRKDYALGCVALGAALLVAYPAFNG